MKNRRVVCVLASALAFTALCASAQSEEAIANTTAAPVAYVYVQTTPGVVVYSAAANGTLTTVKGSPFKVTGQMEDISGKYLVSVGDTILHVYSIASNGAVGKQVSQINTASYGGSQCGGTSGQGSTFEHSGKYLFVQLNTGNKCAAWQTYRLESDGYLQFLGDDKIYQEDGNQVIASTVPTTSSNDKFLYGVFNLGQLIGAGCNSGQCPDFSAFKLATNGMLEKNSAFTEKDPPAASGSKFVPWSWNSPQTDNNGHFAVVMAPIDQFGDTNNLQMQLASYTINSSTGAITSTNNYHNMPIVETGWYTEDEDYLNAPFAMAMSPAGNIFAMATTDWNDSGVQLFHFNGAAAPTYYGNLFYFWPIDKLAWDTHNHLYALQYEMHRLQVFTITTTSVKQTGTEYNLPTSPYGTKGMIVVSK